MRGSLRKLENMIDVCVNDDKILISICEHEIRRKASKVLHLVATCQIQIMPRSVSPNRHCLQRYSLSLPLIDG